MASTSQIHAQVEARVADRIPSAFAQRSSVEMLTMPTGVSTVDAAIGGIPCGGITEIVGPSWTGSFPRARSGRDAEQRIHIVCKSVSGGGYPEVRRSSIVVSKEKIANGN